MEIKYKTYPAYKNSGVEWLGEIPEGWDLRPGLSFLYENKEKNSGMKRDKVLSLSYGKIRVKPKEELTGLVPDSFETYQLINKGDIIFRPTDLQNDKVSLRSGIAEDEGIITSAYLNLRLKSIANNQYYAYLFRSIDNNKVIYGLGSGLRQNISYLDFRRFLFPFPPLPEQTAIASFLDRKTELIDKAIANKEKLIELLKERKQIIIQNAVTGKVVWSEKAQKMVPLTQSEIKSKDSGVEWIGEIPEGWEVMKIKYLIKKAFSGGTPSTDKLDFWDGGIPWISSVDIKKDFLDNTKREISANGLLHSSSNIAPQGSIVFVTRSGILQHTFAISILKRDMAINQDIKCLILSPIITSAYFMILIKGNNNEVLMKTRQQAATVESINIELFNNLSIPVPTIKEQEAIESYIQNQSSKIDRAIALQHTQIEQLKEYKTTLIDSAVTGKIKVS